MSGGISTNNVPLGTSIGEFLGNQIIGGVRSFKRFPRDQVLGIYDALTSGMQAGGGVVFVTKAQADGKLSYNEDQMAWVVLDATAANNGIYQKNGAEGTGGWSRVADLPYEIIKLTATGGTANDIIASMSPQVPTDPASKLYELTPTATNTGPVTVNTNPVKDRLGSNLAADTLIAGVANLLTWEVDHYQLLASLPTDATGILSDAIAARDAASVSATAASGWATTAHGYALAANPINRPAFGPVAAPWPNALGDSLFTNAHAPTALPDLIKVAMGWSSINKVGVSGASIADQASIYGFQMSPSIVNPALVWLGTNDVNLDGFENRTTEQTSLEGLRALLFHLAIPTAKRVNGQAMTVAAGSWSNMGAAIDPGGTACSTSGGVKRAVVTGRHVVVAGWANTSSNGAAAVSIGNNAGSAVVLKDTLTFKRPVISTNSPGGIPTTVIPFVRVYKNVGVDDASMMTVSVGVTSATGAGNDIFIGYVAGLSGRQDEAMPLVLSFNLHHYTPAAEAAQGTNAARRERFNRGIANIVDEAVGLGLWVVPVDAKSVLWDTSLLDTDGLHPIGTGNAALTTEAVNALNAAQSYYHVRNSQLSMGGFSDTMGSDLLPNGRFAIQDFRRVVLPGSGFSAHNNSVNAVVASGASPVLLGWSTEQFDMAGDFSGDTWRPPAGLVTIRAAVTFTTGVDQTAYEVYVFKNGSGFRRLGRTMASGTGELTVAGEMYDLAVDGDAYVIAVLQFSGANATVDGSALKTYFMGMSAF
jgi:hypothetical protein